MKTLAQVKTQAFLLKIKNESVKEDNYPIGLGWFTTSLSSPEEGEISKPADKLIEVTFVGKYKQQYTGYLYAWRYDVTEKGLMQ